MVRILVKCVDQIICTFLSKKIVYLYVVDVQYLVFSSVHNSLGQSSYFKNQGKNKTIQSDILDMHEKPWRLHNLCLLMIFPGCCMQVNHRRDELLFLLLPLV